MEDKTKNITKTKIYIQGRLNSFWQSLVYAITSPYRFFKFVCFSLGFLTLCALLFSAVGVYSFFHSMPDFEKMNFESLKKAGMQSVQRRFENKQGYASYQWVSVSQINRDYLFAIVMSEDSGFFEHHGINYDALVDSLAENIKRREYAFGASTISQQVVKNLFLTNSKSLTRKTKEILITRDLERRFNKNQILELYLNIAEFGPDIFGVEQAAHHFYGKPASKINAAEGAFIALMLPSPRRNHYAIYENKNLTKSKRRHIRRILASMVSEEFISFKQYQEYLNYPFFRSSRYSHETTRLPASIKYRKKHYHK